MNLNLNPLAEEHINYLKEVFKKEFPNEKISIYDTGIEPEYQGCILVLLFHTPIQDLDKELDRISEDELNMGDDSYRLIKMGRDIYSLEICE